MDATQTVPSGLPSSGPLPGLAAPGGSWEQQALVMPQGPRTFNMYDRQIYIPHDEVSLYTLARKWVQNLPEEDTAPPEPPSLQLLPLPPQEPQAVEQLAAPAYLDTYTQQHYEPEEALRRLKAHWITVRQHWQETSNTRMLRQQQRVMPWLQSAMARTADAVVPGSLAPGLPENPMN